jgi:hypothetical protein
LTTATSKEKISRISSKNILVIADSCFQEPLTRGIALADDNRPKTSLAKFLDTKSRIAITSGGNEPVLDGAAGENSIFARSLLKFLGTKKDAFTSLELYSFIRQETADMSVCRAC